MCVYIYHRTRVGPACACGASEAGGPVVGLSKLPRKEPTRCILEMRVRASRSLKAFAPAESRFRADKHFIPGPLPREMAGNSENAIYPIALLRQAIRARGPTSPLGRCLVESKPSACRFAPYSFSPDHFCPFRGTDNKQATCRLHTRLCLLALRLRPDPKRLGAFPRRLAPVIVGCSDRPYSCTPDPLGSPTFCSLAESRFAIWLVEVDAI